MILCQRAASQRRPLPASQARRPLAPPGAGPGAGAGAQAVAARLTLLHGGGEVPVQHQQVRRLLQQRGRLGRDRGPGQRLAPHGGGGRAAGRTAATALPAPRRPPPARLRLQLQLQRLRRRAPRGRAPLGQAAAGAGPTRCPGRPWGKPRAAASRQRKGRPGGHLLPAPRGSGTCSLAAAWGSGGRRPPRRGQSRLWLSAGVPGALREAAALSAVPVAAKTPLQFLTRATAEGKGPSHRSPAGCPR